MARRGNATWFLRFVKRSSWIMPTTAPSRIRQVAEEWLCAMPSSIISECRHFPARHRLSQVRIADAGDEGLISGLECPRLDPVDVRVMERLQVERDALRG